MKKLGKLKLTQNVELMNEDEMKMVTGGRDTDKCRQIQHDANSYGSHFDNETWDWWEILYHRYCV